MTTLEKMRADIRQLTKTYPFVNHKDTYVKEEDVIDIINKYAEQEPCDDAVSRRAVIKLVRGCNSALEEPRIFNSHNSGVVFEQYINELPSVRPQEPKTGWHIAHGMYEDRFWCSCGYIEIIDSNTSKWNYCPNCGAKMVEQKETETWHGIHAQITAPNGTFERIFNDADDDYDI